MRKSPYRHPVRSHSRSGYPVDRYVRGQGSSPRIQRNVNVTSLSPNKKQRKIDEINIAIHKSEWAKEEGMKAELRADGSILYTKDFQAGHGKYRGRITFNEILSRLHGKDARFLKKKYGRYKGSAIVNLNPSAEREKIAYGKSIKAVREKFEQDQGHIYKIIKISRDQGKVKDQLGNNRYWIKVERKKQSWESRVVNEKAQQNSTSLNTEEKHYLSEMLDDPRHRKLDVVGVCIEHPGLLRLRDKGLIKTNKPLKHNTIIYWTLTDEGKRVAKDLN